MITTLVLGAGMSKAYGYPLGSELLTQVKGVLENDKNRNREMAGLLHGLNHLGVESLDEYMEENEASRPVIKAIIAELLLKCEHADHLIWPVAESPYHLLVRGIHPDRFKDFRIVNFNYDRILPAIFVQSLMTRFKCDEKKAHEMLKALKIIHPHGRLLNLPGEAGFPSQHHPNGFSYGVFLEQFRATSNHSDRDFVPWHWEWHRSIIAQAQYSLRTCTENKAVCGEAQNAIVQADRVIFLGFGFHGPNMAVLGYPFNDVGMSRKRVIASANLAGVVERLVGLDYPEITLVKGRTCTQLLKEDVSLEDPRGDIVQTGHWKIKATTRPSKTFEEAR